jgi:hypothetical protein
MTMTQPAVLISLVFAISTSQVFATDAIATLDTGRQVRGRIVSELSTAEFLTLQQDRAGARLTWRANWDRVVSIRWQNATLDAEILRDRLRKPGGGLTHPQPARTARDVEAQAQQPMLVSDSPTVRPRLQFAEPTTSVLRCNDDGLCGRGIIVGVRDDSLAAYPDLESNLFPHGVPLSERSFARDLLRGAKAIGVYGPPDFVGPVPLPTPRGEHASWNETRESRGDLLVFPPIDGRSAAPMSAVEPSVIHDAIRHGWLGTSDAPQPIIVAPVPARRMPNAVP